MGPWSVLCFGRQVVRRLTAGLVGIVAVCKFGSISFMAVSMLVSLAAYAFAFGLSFAIGFVLLLFVHEFGHFFASRVVGLHVSKPLFIPFLGAVISLKQRPYNAKMEANIAIGGPAAGTLSALVCLALYLWTDDILILVVAYAACLLNLFNLIPCEPLDGGRIAAAISPNLWWVGSFSVGALFCYTQNIFLFVILVVSLLRLWKGDVLGSYYDLTLRQRLAVLFWYLGLLSVLGVMTLYIADLLHN
ncbi:putative membrane protein [Propionispora sp. 2/2-37]|uniref:site-2 protease family protein n=1 Tax=Propionispora sp. 2/2-37 TaxID=1677858 RepID=UPI0006C5A83A|nr:site-2 protease family protein [Propionispora sp. 2/2-37]CUH94396.1 putative membrane protein [Propionispora sp. 2/2-37]